MTTYVPMILTWHSETDAATLARIERDADAAHVGGIHDTRVELIARTAFDGLGDSTGSDEFGYSAAWADLADHVEIAGEDLPEGVDYWNVGAYLATWRDVAGCRYVLAYWDANGSRSAVGYATRADMMTAYREIETAYLAWEDASDAF